jgi:uncharacterized protein (TIGR03437 family)
MFYVAAALTPSALAQSVNLRPDPTRILGHPKRELVTSAPNYVEGRELSTPQGLAVDNSVTPPILYVADTGNNRVLGWRNPVGAANGAAADIVIGQRDRFTSNAFGPGTTFTTGLNAPTGVVVDSEGNLYVLDTGNNRIVRYPKPFEQGATDLISIDLVLGQETLGSLSGGNVGRLPNRGRATPSANTLVFADGANAFRVRATFDNNGNLWVSDSGNNRVLRYPRRVLTPGNFGPDADIVLGQNNFTTNAPLSTGNPRDKSGLSAPSGIAWGPDARLYVCDSVGGFGRVLVYRNPSAIAQNADRILGLVVLQQGQAPPPRVNDLALASPESVTLLGATPIVVDTANHRLVRYDLPDNWPAESTQFSPRMRDVVGQADFNSGDPNRGARVPSALGYNLPVDATLIGNNLFVVDANNHRVVMIPGGAPFNIAASKVFGQLDLDLASPNLVEGREFFFAGQFQGRIFRGGGLAIDGNTIYIADTLNNRVLGYRDIRSVRLGQPADLVIGQVSLTRTTINSPDGNQNVPNLTGLFLPHALAVDAQGNLWVADSGNSRVLRFPRPFENANNLRPNLVIGQTSFTTRITDASSRTMSFPSGLAFTAGGHLLVSDAQHNRVLFFLRPTGGDFTNGQAASLVFGQPDFFSVASSGELNRMSNPRGIAVDGDDRMYVADTNNNRLHIYNRVPQAGVDPLPALTLGGFNLPVGVTVDRRTNEVWVTDGNANRAVRFPAYENLSVTSRFNLAVSSPFPLDLKVDANSNLILTDSANRVAFYYQLQNSLNAANYQSTALAPGTIAAMFASGGRFGDDTVVASTTTLPRTLGDVQVLVNDQPAPLFFVSPGQINWQVPWGVTPGSVVDVVVVRAGSGQVLAAGEFLANVVSPGMFTSTANGFGQIAAVNAQDGTINGPANPVARGQVISLYGTGVGPVSNQPQDGAPAPTSPLAEGEKPDVNINGRSVPVADVLFSGLAPGFVGLWQVNVRIPDIVAPGNSIPVVLLLRSVPSQNRLGTVIAVKQ